MEASLKKYLGLRLKKVFSKRLKLIIIMIIIIILIIIGYTIPSNQWSHVIRNLQVCWHSSLNSPSHSSTNLIQEKKILSKIYLFKVNSRNTRKRCEACSNLTIKLGAFIVNFEHISHLFLEVLSLLWTIKW